MKSHIASVPEHRFSYSPASDEPLAGFDYQYSRKEVLPLELLTCKSISNNVIHGEPTVSEEDVSKCMHSHIIEKRSTELDAVEEENEIKDENQNKEPLVLTKRSSRKLRAKLKETLIVHEEPLVSTKLSLRKLRAKLKETLIAHENRCKIEIYKSGN